MKPGRDPESDVIRLTLGFALCAILALGAAAPLAYAPAAQAQEAGVGGDPAAGEKVMKKCLACHTLEPGKKKVGPSLHGVVGRTPGTLEGFRYSKAMVAFGEGGAVWDVETLDAFLTGPRKFVKGTKMSFPGLKKEKDRADLIAYLQQATAEE